MEYEKLQDGTRMISRTYEDTYSHDLWVNVQCPYCEYEQEEKNLTNCGSVYEIECADCKKVYKMYFDAS